MCSDNRSLSFSGLIENNRFHISEKIIGPWENTSVREERLQHALKMLPQILSDPQVHTLNALVCMAEKLKSQLSFNVEETKINSSSIIADIHVGAGSL